MSTDPPPPPPPAIPQRHFLHQSHEPDGWRCLSLDVRLVSVSFTVPWTVFLCRDFLPPVLVLKVTGKEDGVVNWKDQWFSSSPSLVTF